MGQTLGDQMVQSFSIKPSNSPQNLGGQQGPTDGTPTNAYGNTDNYNAMDALAAYLGNQVDDAMDSIAGAAGEAWNNLTGPEDTLAQTNASSLSQAQSANNATNAYMQNSVNQTDDFMKGNLGALNEFNDTAPHMSQQVLGENDGLLTGQIQSPSRADLEAIVASDQEAGFHLEHNIQNLDGIGLDANGMPIPYGDTEFDVDGAFGLGSADKNIWSTLADNPTLTGVSNEDRKNILSEALKTSNDGGSYNEYLDVTGFKDAAMSKDATALDKLRYHAELAISAQGTTAGDTLTGALMDKPQWIGTAINGTKTKGAFDAFKGNVETNFYNQFEVVNDANGKATEARTATFNNGVRDVTLEWNATAANRARAATNPNTAAKYTTDETIRNTNFDTFDALLRASFETGNISSVNIEGGWRPSGGKAHPQGRGLDVNYITFDTQAPNQISGSVIPMSVKDSNGNYDRTTKDVSSSYDSRVKEFSHTLAKQGGVNQVTSPWEEYKFNSKAGSFGWKENTGSTTGSSILGKHYGDHRNHLHFALKAY